MANAKTLVVGGQPLNVIDDTARSNAQTALNNAEYNRQGQIGKYGGQNIAAILVAAPWTADGCHTLLLQPQSRAESLRQFLSENGYRIARAWYASALLDFNTQFANGYDYNSDPRDYISRFMAPGYLMIGAGVTWMPKKWFTMTFTPATWRGTFVTSSRLSAEGAYGVDPGKRLLSEFGGNLKLEFNYEFLPNMTLYSRVDFYSNYLDKPQNVDVRWDTQINMKINKWFAANLNLNLIYDDDTKILQQDGRQGARIQFKEALGIGLQAAF